VPGSREPRAIPFATSLRRLRWPVVLAWILAIVLLHGLSSSLPNVTIDGASAYLPVRPSTKVALLQQAADRLAGQLQTNTAIVVFAVSHGGLTPTDHAVVVAAREAVAGLVGHVTGLAAPGRLQPSADGEAMAFTVSITGPASSTGIDRGAVNAIRAMIAVPASRAPAGLADAVTGPAAVNADISAGNQQSVLLLTALIIVAVILLLVYRSPVLWLLPLAGAVAAIIVAQASSNGLANAGLTVSALSSDFVILLVFGAASDYVLLLVHRYREELRHRAATEDAMAVTPGKIDIDALCARQAIVETAALEAGRDPKSIDVLVRINVAKGAALRPVVDDIRRVAGAVGFGHFFIEQMCTDDTVDQAIASALTLLDCADR